MDSGVVTEAGFLSAEATDTFRCQSLWRTWHLARRKRVVCETRGSSRGRGRERLMAVLFQTGQLFSVGAMAGGDGAQKGDEKCSFFRWVPTRGRSRATSAFILFFLVQFSDPHLSSPLACPGAPFAPSSRATCPPSRWAAAAVSCSTPPGSKLRQL